MCAAGRIAHPSHEESSEIEFSHENEDVQSSDSESEPEFERLDGRSAQSTMEGHIRFRNWNRGWGCRPNMNDGSVRVFDEYQKLLFVFGGVRWASDPNPNSPTRAPTADFFSFDLARTRWTDLSSSLRFEDNSSIPFIHNRKSRSETDHPSSPGSSAPRQLPALHEASGTVVYDNVTSTSYLIIYGGLLGHRNSSLGTSKTRRSASASRSRMYERSLLQPAPSSQLIIINLRVLSWRFVQISGGHSGSVKARASASILITGVPTATSPVSSKRSNSNIFLLLFGGRRINRDCERSIECTTFCVADLRTCEWIIRDERTPLNVGALGNQPHMKLFRSRSGGQTNTGSGNFNYSELTKEGNSTTESVLILRGVQVNLVSCISVLKKLRLSILIKF